jgi:hypothetical protein
MSVYEMQGLLLRLGRTVNAATRWRSAELARLTPAVSQQVNAALADVCSSGNCSRITFHWARE